MITRGVRRKRFETHIPNFAKAIRHGARVLVVLALASLLLSPQASRTAETAAGDLDLTFGMGGKVRTDFFGATDTASAVGLLSDGRIVLGGSVSSSNIPESPILFGLARYQPDGSLDPTFGSGGKVTTGGNFVFAEQARLFDLAVQPDNKIVAGGMFGSIGGFQGDAIIARYNVNGSLDSMFGTSGIVRMRFVGSMAEANALVLQPDGRIVFGGSDFVSSRTPQTQRALARLNIDGSLDTSFGSGGKVVLNTQGRITGMALQPDGKIVATGGPGPLVQRLNSNGSPDPAFGSGGDGANPGSDFFIYAVALQTDGKIVIAGEVNNHSDIALIRYNTNGTLDPSFGSGGIVITDFGNQEIAFAVVIQPNGKIVIGGTANNKFIVLRYNSNGSLDPAFNPPPIDFGCVDPPSPFLLNAATGVAIQPDGKIVGGGFACRSSDFVLARYNGDPAFDFCIQDDSNGSILSFNSNTGAYQFINCSKAGIGLAGTGQITRNGCKIDFQASGPDPKRPDRNVTASVNTCTQQGSASVKLLPSGMMFGIQDSDLRNNTCACP